jgi:hypothetical protein
MSAGDVRPINGPYHRTRSRFCTGISKPQLAVQETRSRGRTIQLCIHCMENPAGFWVSRRSGRAVHRPWCLSCCQELDPELCDVIPFAG